MVFELSFPQPSISGQLLLDGSKSISNRLLIIQALCPEKFEIHHLSNSNDTVTLQKLLAGENDVLDVGPAGTTFRFLTAYQCTQDRTVTLTGSKRMLQRPIGPLVDALRQIGAQIEYLGDEGYPPLKISPSATLGEHNKVGIHANVSSQFISALIMIAPCLPNGLEIELIGQLVSPSYLQMTLDLIRSYGVNYVWKDNVISISKAPYRPKHTTVEADWSGASYHYILSCFAESAEVELQGLFEHSVQGDSIVADLMTPFGIKTSRTEKGVMLEKSESIIEHFKHDFTSCPDIAQSMAVICAGLGIKGTFTGVETLSIKETDRVYALQKELGKLDVVLHHTPNKEKFEIEGLAKWDYPVRFETYHDHRMAMAFAPLGIRGNVRIEDPKVVGKSYISFWDHLTQLGAQIQLIESE